MSLKTLKVGLLVGRERSFPDALIERIGEISTGVTAEYAKVDLTRLDTKLPYAVLVDRISHDVPCFQPFLKFAALKGTHVINNPFWRIADDKFFNAALAAELGIAVPKTALLPQKEYGADITAGSLSNLVYPLDWDGMERELGYPMFLKPHWGGGFKDVSRVDNRDELLKAYDRSKQLTMIAQEAISWTQYVRCIVIGKTEVLVALWDPRLGHFERYTRATETMPPLSSAMHARVTSDALTICRALGYQMNTVEFAIREGVPYAIDYMNSAPDFDRTSLTTEAFAWVVDQMARLCVRLAESPFVVPRAYTTFVP